MHKSKVTVDKFSSHQGLGVVKELNHRWYWKTLLFAPWDWNPTCCFLWFCTPPRGYTRWGEISIIVFTFVWWNKGWTVCKDRLYQSVGLHFLIADKQVISLLREDNARVVMIDRFASCHSKLVEKLHRKIVYHRQGLSSFDQAATFCRLHTGNWVVDKLQVRLFSFLNSFKFVKQWRLYCVCVCMYEAQLKTFSPACGNTKWNDEF